MAKLLIHDELDKTLGDSSRIHRIVAAARGIEQTVKATLEYVADVTDLDFSILRRCWMPKWVSIS